MKHIAIRSRSIRKLAPYTTPGLGDMSHSVMLGYVYGKAHNTPVTIHLTADKWNREKPETYAALASLYPENTIYVESHPVENLPEDEWLDYLRSKGYDNVETYHYGDYVHKYDSKTNIDISKYLKNFPQLPGPTDVSVDLPDKFVTAQWDSTDATRRLKVHQIKVIEDVFKTKGFEIVTVGGEASDPQLKRSLRHIGYAMSKAGGHIGVDSGFMHFAMMYHEPKNIHVYVREEGGHFSHHFYRARDNGCDVKVLKY